EVVVVTKFLDNQPPDKMDIESGGSIPALYINEKEKMSSKNDKIKIPENRKRQRKGENWDVAESIRCLIADLYRDSLYLFIEVLEMPRDVESNNSSSLQMPDHFSYLHRVVSFASHKWCRPGAEND
nr:hypothetical protein [Tanacetum cinerariifolium]